MRKVANQSKVRFAENVRVRITCDDEVEYGDEGDDDDSEELSDDDSEEEEMVKSVRDELGQEDVVQDGCGQGEYAKRIHRNWLS